MMKCACGAYHSLNMGIGNMTSELNPNEIVRMYNFPWSGKIVSHITCCLYCGDNGPKYSLSSRAGRCLNKECQEAYRNGAKPIPELLEKAEIDGDRLTRAEMETVLSPEASAKFKEIMDKGLAKPKITPKALPTRDK